MQFIPQSSGWPDPSGKSYHRAEAVLRLDLQNFVISLGIIGFLAAFLIPSVLIERTYAQELPSPSVTISILSDDPDNPASVWGNEVQVYGSITNLTEQDILSILWGDGTDPESGISIADGVWGLATHTYSQDAIGSRQITIQIDRGGEIVANSTLTINILKRTTFVNLDPITEITQGENVTISGTLFDSVLGTPLSNVQLQFGGSGTGNNNLPPTTTDENGLFSTTGPSPDLAEDALIVEVTLGNATEIYEQPFSNIITYDIISAAAIPYEVPTGNNVTVNLSDFNTSLTFANITSGGELIAYTCEITENPRYIDLDLDACINIRSSSDVPFQMAEGSVANVTISISDLPLPQGYNFDDLHMFRVQGELVSDITLIRNESANQITGQTVGFSKFILAVPDFPPQTEKSRRIPIVLGTNVLEFRDVQSHANASAIIEIDDSRLSSGDSATLTITDPDGNINPEKIDSTSAFLFSDSSEPDGIHLDLHETSIDNGIFEASFSITSGSSSGSQLHARPSDTIFVNYTQSAGRLLAIIEGVTEAGVADAIDYTVDPTEVTFMPIGGAVDLQLVGAQLGSSGKVTITMSYANAITRGQDPASFRLFHLDGGTWFDITLPDGVNNVTKTVTGETTTLSPFTIGVETGIPGGAGGGGYTGSGLVVDVVASIVKSSGSGSGGAGSSSYNTGSGTFVEQVASGQDVKLVAAIPQSSSTLHMQFAHVLTPGNIAVEEKTITSLASLFTFVNSTNAEIAFPDGQSFTTAGHIFEIKPSTGLVFEGSIEITIPYDTNSVRSRDDDVRFLHYDGSKWNDVTIGIDENAGTVTGRVDSFSPVVAALVNDGTFPSIYFIENPFPKIVQFREHGSLSTPDAPQVRLIGSDGSAIRDFDSVPPSSEVLIVDSIKNLQRVSQNYSYIVEVVDSDNVAIYLETMHSNYLEAGQVREISAILQTPTLKGNYTLKLLLIDDSGQAVSLLLANVTSMNFRVL